MERKNSPAVKRTTSKISPTKIKSRSKSKRMACDENQNEHTENNKSIKITSKENQKNDSVLQTSDKMNLSKYKDYIHCCKCFSTFYTLTNLINHFDKCNVQRSESESFKDFQQQQTHSSSHQVTTTKTTTATTGDEEEENQLFNNDFVNQEISCSPVTPENNDDDDEEEAVKITKNNDDYSASENVNVDSGPLNVGDQNEVKEQHPFKCPVESCSSLSFPNPTSFIQHKRQVHNLKDKGNNKAASVLCSTCGKSVIGQFNLLCHMNEHTGYNPYKCHLESCDKSFTLRDRYLYHLYVTHRTKKDVLKCPDKNGSGCDQAFTTTAELKKHLENVHAGSIFYRCTKCDEGFLTTEARKNHHLRVHRELKYMCEVENCGKSFKKTVHLKRHQVSHQSEKPFQCDFPGCRVKFKDKSGLAKHNKVAHQNKEQCLCSQCGKSFQRKSNYRKHLLVHAQEKSHICQYCGRGFSLASTLKVHLRNHLGEKSSNCRFCDKSFSQLGSLTRHEQTHTKINPYKCGFCDAVFPDNRPLKKHVAAAHADQEFDLNTRSTYQREKPRSSLN